MGAKTVIRIGSRRDDFIVMWYGNARCALNFLWERGLYILLIATTWLITRYPEITHAERTPLSHTNLERSRCSHVNSEHGAYPVQSRHEKYVNPKGNFRVLATFHPVHHIGDAFIGPHIRKLYYKNKGWPENKGNNAAGDYIHVESLVSWRELLTWAWCRWKIFEECHKCISNGWWFVFIHLLWNTPV